MDTKVNTKDGDAKEPFLHRGKRYIGLWVLPGEWEVMTEAAWRVGKSRNQFILSCVDHELKARDMKDLSEKLFEVKTQALRERSTHYKKCGRPPAKNKEPEVDPDGSISL